MKDFNLKRSKKAHLTMITPSKKSNNDNKMFNFKRSTIRAINKAHPALTMLKIMVSKNRGLFLLEEKGVISRLNENNDE